MNSSTKTPKSPNVRFSPKRRSRKTRKINFLLDNILAPPPKLDRIALEPPKRMKTPRSIPISWYGDNGEIWRQHLGKIFSADLTSAHKRAAAILELHQIDIEQFEYKKELFQAEIQTPAIRKLQHIKEKSAFYRRQNTDDFRLLLGLIGQTMATEDAGFHQFDPNANVNDTTFTKFVSGLSYPIVECLEDEHMSAMQERKFLEVCRAVQKNDVCPSGEADFLALLHIILDDDQDWDKGQ